MGLVIAMYAAAAVAVATLVRFVCQNTDSKGRLLNWVVIAEQTSVEALEGASSDTVDGSSMIDTDPDAEFYTGKTAFRMRIYKDVSLVSDVWTKEDIIAELLEKPASRGDRFLMDFPGLGGRFDTGFVFDSQTPYWKSLSVDLLPDYQEDWLDGRMKTANGAATLVEDGSYNCEEPVLVPVSGER